MSAADEANQRLDAALTRLETALQARLAAQQAAGAEAERTRFDAELVAVRSECDNLKQTSAAVSQRLDAAIGTIKSMLTD